MSTRSAAKSAPGGTLSDTDGMKPDSTTPSTSSSARVTRQSRRATFECEDCGKKFLTEQMKTRHSLIHSGEKPHGCELCGRQFRRADEVQRHKTRHSEEDGICCFVCSLKLDSCMELVDHMKKHSINFKSKVSNAGYTFRSSSVVKTYRDLFRSGNPQPCYVCFRDFPGSEELLQHLGQHTAVELLKGSSDKELWKSSSSYAELQYVKWRRRRASSLHSPRSSRRRATSDKTEVKSEFTHVCRVCHQMFKGVESLLYHWMEKKGKRGHEGAVGGEGYDTHHIHMHNHGRRLWFRCDLCGETFTSVDPVVSHLEVHADTEDNMQPPEAETDTQVEIPLTDTESVTESTVKVEEIEKESGDKGKILFHMSDESDGELDPGPSGKFECFVCMKVAKCKSALRRHMMIHQEDKPFLCPVCGKKYARPEDLKQHLIRHVADLYQQGNSTNPNSRFKCDICTAVFQCEKDLQFHGVYHGVYRPNARTYADGQSTVCPICGKMLQKATSLPSHIELHTQDRKFECGVCGRTFKSERNRNRHQKIHTGVKEFVCDVCGKGLSRKAEYEAHLNRHNTDPNFNGKAGRKKGTKVINNKVIYSKDGYGSAEDKGAMTKKTKSRVLQRDQKILHLDSNGDVLMDMSALSGVTHSLLNLPEKTIIPHKNKKRKMGMVMAENTTESSSNGHEVVLQSVETQTEVLTSEQSSLAHNIDIITSELTETDLTTAEVTSVDGVSTAEDEAIIIIVQDPTTGENEVLTIKSFQEGASKLISPNEELMKALESFQKNKSLDEMTTLPAGSIDATQIKTEVLDHPENETGKHSAGDVTMATTAPVVDDVPLEILCDATLMTKQDPLHESDMVSVLEQREQAAVVQQDDNVSVVAGNQPQLPAINVSDQTMTPSGDDSQSGSKLSAASHQDPALSSVLPGQPDNLNVKVVSFTLDETTGILVPIYPETSNLKLSVSGDSTTVAASDTIPQEDVATNTFPGTGVDTDITAGAAATDKLTGASVTMDTISGSSVAMDTIKGTTVAMDTINRTMDTPAKMAAQVSTLSNLHDSSETTITSSILLNTDGDLTAVEALMQMKSPQHAGIRPHLVGPGGDRMTCPNVLQKAVSVPVLKCTPDGRVIKTPAGSPAVFKSVKLSPTLPSSPGKDLQTQSEIASTSGNIVDEEDDVVDDDGISNDDEAIEEPVRKKRKAKKDSDWTPAKPVRKSLRNSYEGVSKIVASLLRQKKPRGTVKKIKAKTDIAAVDAAEGVRENSEPDREFVKCNICRSLQPWEELRQHIDTEHGTNAYQCGLCSMGFDSNVDLHMHLLGHEKDDRIKRTLSLLTGDTEVRRQLASAGVSSGLSGEASAAILALERGGDLKEVLATVEVDVDDLINTNTGTSNKEEETNKEDVVNIDTKTSTEDGKTIVTMSNVKSNVKDDSGDSGSSQNQTSVETSSKRNKEDMDVDSKKSTTCTPNGDSCIENPTSAETSSTATECLDEVKQPGDCAACHESFMSSFSLKKHNSELPLKQHTCDRTASEECLDRESGDESREGLTCVCGLCGYKFVNVNLLTRHVKAHYREKPFSCDMCSKKYARRDELVKHRMSHQAVVVNKPKQERRKFLPRTKSGKYPCHLCKQQFKTYQNRYTHVLCHESDEATTSEKVDIDKPRDKSNVTCDVCGLVLSGPRHLVRHKLIHTNERPWLCQECGKSFLRSDDLRVHQRRQHNSVGNSDTNKESKFRKVCPFCKRAFTSFNSFRNHVKTHKSERLDGSLKCEICGKVFIKHISLRNHQQIHKNTYRRGMKRNTTLHKPATLTYNCEDCGKQIKSKSNFVRHMKLHNEGKHHICSKCTKGFARQADLRMHERLHTGERPFLCNLCGKGFTSNSALSHHVKMHNQPVVYKYSCTQCEGLFASRKEFKDHVKSCAPKQMEIVFIQETETVPIETIEYV